LDLHRTRKNERGSGFAGEFPCDLFGFSSSERSNKEPTATSPVAASNVLTRSMRYWLVAATDEHQVLRGCFVARSVCYDADTANAMASASARARARVPIRQPELTHRCRVLSDSDPRALDGSDAGVAAAPVDRSIRRPVARVQPQLPSK
jgi:hypothetical protein